MTWNIQVEGHSQQGPDEKQQQDYLAQKFSEVIQQINQESTTQVTKAMLQTNFGQYDLVAQKEISGVSQR